MDDNFNKKAYLQNSRSTGTNASLSNASSSNPATSSTTISSSSALSSTVDRPSVLLDKTTNSSSTITDKDVLREAYEFLPGNEPNTIPDTSSTNNKEWEQKLLHQYHAHLYKEFVVGDLSRYREGQIGLRWRTEREVITGKGQYICGSLQCDEVSGLHSYETPFKYVEKSVTKEALVKIRLCGICATRMFHKQINSSSSSAPISLSRGATQETSKDDDHPAVDASSSRHHHHHHYHHHHYHHHHHPSSSSSSARHPQNSASVRYRRTPSGTGVRSSSRSRSPRR